MDKYVHDDKYKIYQDLVTTNSNKLQHCNISSSAPHYYLSRSLPTSQFLASGKFDVRLAYSSQLQGLYSWLYSSLVNLYSAKMSCKS